MRGCPRWDGVCVCVWLQAKGKGVKESLNVAEKLAKEAAKGAERATQKVALETSKLATEGKQLSKIIANGAKQGATRAEQQAMRVAKAQFKELQAAVVAAKAAQTAEMEAAKGTFEVFIKLEKLHAGIAGWGAFRQTIRAAVGSGSILWNKYLAPLTGVTGREKARSLDDPPQLASFRAFGYSDPIQAQDCATETVNVGYQ